MPLIKFPVDPDKSPFFKDIVEEGYHIFNMKNARNPNFYPNEFPSYPGVKIKNIKVGDQVTIRIFFRIGSDENMLVEGGYLELEVEEKFDRSVLALVMTKLPEEFALGTDDSIEIFEEEILFCHHVVDN